MKLWRVGGEEVEVEMGDSKLLSPQNLVRPPGNQMQWAASIFAVQIPAGWDPALCGPLETLWVHISDSD